MTTSTAESRPSSCIVCLTRHEETGAWHLRILSLPLFRIVEDYELEPTCTAAKLIHPSACMITAMKTWGHVYFLSWDLNGVCQLRSYGETVPSAQLDRLLTAGDYTQAVVLAQQHGMDVESVYRAELEDILRRAQEEPTFVLEEEAVQHCIGLLNSLPPTHESSAFVHRWCVSLPTRSMEGTLALLKAGERFLSSLDALPGEGETVERRREMGRTLKLLGTYQLIQAPREKQKGEVGEEEVGRGFDARAWQVFRRRSLFEVLCEYVSRGQLLLARILWTRHAVETGFVANLYEALCSLPDQLPVDILMSWIQDAVVPYINQSTQLDKILLWIDTRARLLEQREQRPHHALKIVQLVMDMVQNRAALKEAFCMDDAGVLCTQTPLSRLMKLSVGVYDDELRLAAMVKVLTELRNQLADILYLWEHHEFYISLLDYAKEQPRQIAQALLDRVQCPDMLELAIQKDFMPYLDKHKLDVDDILVEYCTELIDNMCVATCPRDVSEKRLLILIEKIKDANSKMDLFIELLRHLDVPWSEEVMEVVKLAQTLKHVRRFEEFEEQVRLMELKTMLLSYGVSRVQLGDMSVASSLVHVLKQKSVSTQQALRDLRMLTQAFHHLSEHDVYVSWLSHVCQKGMFEEIAVTMSEMKRHEVAEVCESVLIWIDECIWNLCRYRALSNSGETFYNLCKSGHMIINAFGELDSCDRTRLYAHLNRERETAFRASYLIWSEYQLMVHPKLLSHEKERLEVMQTYCRETLSNANSPSDILHTNDMKIVRLSELLDISCRQLYTILSECLARSGSVARSISLCQTMLERYPSADTAMDVMRISNFFSEHDDIQQIEKEYVNQIGAIRQIAEAAVQFATPDNLPHALDYFKHVECVEMAICQTESGDFKNIMRGSAPTRSAAFDETIDSLFDHQFTDNNLVMDTQSMLHLVKPFMGKLKPRSSQTKQESKKGKSADTNTVTHAFTDFLSSHQAYQTALAVDQLNFESEIRGRPPSFANADEVVGFRRLLETLVQKSLSSPVIDGLLSFSYIVALPQKEAFSGIRGGISTISKEFNRLSKIAGIGIGAAILWQQRTFFVQLETLAKNARWWHQFQLLGIDFEEEKFRVSDLYRREFIPLLLEKTNCDLYAVRDFCQEYLIEDDFLLFSFIKIQLQEHTNGYQSRIIGIYDEIANKEKLGKLLLDLQKHFSSYDYEIIYFVCSLLTKIDPENAASKKGISMLDVLRNYIRKYPPSVGEMNAVARRMKISTNDFSDKEQQKLYLEKFEESQMKLPFFEMIVTPWKILENELDETTVTKLLPLAIPLGLSSDEFYVVTITKLLRQLSDNTGREQFLEIRSLVSKIRDLEIQWSTWNHAAECFPVGNDRIQCYKNALQSAEKLLKQISSDKACTKDRESRIESCRVALTNTEQSLIRAEIEWKLKTTDFLGFLSDAPNSDTQALIVKIYEEKCGEIADDFDLHAFCQDLVPKNSDFKLENIRVRLLQTWLMEKLDVHHPDFLSSSCLYDGASIPVMELNLRKKICFMAESLPREKVINELLRVAYDKSHKVMTVSRIRALCCLLQFAKPNEYESIIKIDDIKEYLQLLHYFLDCEDLRISVTVSELLKLDKRALCKGLWVKRQKEFKIAMFICNIMLDYCIYDERALWDQILAFLLHCKKFSYIAGLLKTISAVNELLSIPSLEYIWNETVLELLGSTSEISETVLDLMSCCPFPASLDSTNILSKMLKLDLTKTTDTIIHALPCVHFLASVDAGFDESVLSSFCSKLSKNDVCRALIKCSCVSSQETPVIRHLYQLIDRNRWYDVLLSNTDLLIAVIDFLTRSDSIENLLKTILSASMDDKANQLLTGYFQYHLPGKTAPGMKTDELILLFKKHKNRDIL